MNKRSLTQFAAACALAATAITAQAAPVTWNYEISLAWGTGANGYAAPTFSGGSGTTFYDETLITWGSSSGNHAVSGGGRSGVGITDTPATGSVTSDGATALTNSITHYNNELSGGSSTLKTAMLVADVKLYDGSTPVVDFINPFAIHFIETTNAAPCLPSAVTVCDDVFVLTMGALNHEFVYDGYTYYASIFENTTALNPLPNAACTAAGSSAPCTGFMTPEFAHTTAQLAFRITTKKLEIPEPGILALLGIGLVGIGAMRRRRS